MAGKEGNGKAKPGIVKPHDERINGGGLMLKEVVMTPTDDRDVLEVLKAELDLIEDGGYGRSVRTPWKPTSVFQDSLSCINFGDPARSHSCNECLLLRFVPPERRSECVPCHHIPLNEAGETVGTMELLEDQQELETAVKNWLRANIKRLETERAHHEP
jgi:hypothetical protein